MAPPAEARSARHRVSESEADDPTLALTREARTDPPPTSPEGEASAWDVAASTRLAGAFRPDIEGLRAVAILAVLAYHARIPGTGGGFIGVDVFFVISGSDHRPPPAGGDLHRAPRPACFYARRARRLLPAALVVIAVTGSSAVILFATALPRVALMEPLQSLYVSNF